jgi:hypothetical protein
MGRNFATFRKVLESFAGVADAAAGLPAAAAAPKPAAVPEVAPAAEGAGAPALPQPSVLETVVRRRLADSSASPSQAKGACHLVAPTPRAVEGCIPSWCPVGSGARVSLTPH